MTGGLWLARRWIVDWRRSVNRRLAPAALAVASITTVAACATDKGAPSTSSPDCTQAALAEPATGAAEAMSADNLYTIDSVRCADGWAVTAGLLSSKGNPDMGAPTSFVFRQQDDSWVAQDKKAVCGTNPVTTTPPTDAAIPAALFLSGCAAG